MGLSIAFILIVIVLCLSLFRKRIGKTRKDYWEIFILAVCVGLWSAFVFVAPGAIAFYDYFQQGRVDFLASEIPKGNPPVLPPMSLTQFLTEASPSVFGVPGALVYVVLAVVSALSKKIFHRLTYYIVGYNLLIWIWHLILYSYFLPLPSVAQNVMFFLVMGLPCLLSVAFNIFWLYWTSKQKLLEAS